MIFDNIRSLSADRHPDFRDCAMFMGRLENGAGVMADISYSGPSQIFSMPAYWEFRIWCARGMLTFNYVSPTVTVYTEGEPSPVVYEGLPAGEDYLDEFLAGFTGGDGKAMTENVLRSTACALKIQQIADQRGKESLCVSTV